MHIKITDRLKRGERGDTLVEVLITIVVISVVLGGAYVTVNRSLTATRSAQERSIALKLAESQIEQLKGLITTDSTQIFGGGVPLTFCITSAGAVVAAPNPVCSVGTSGTPTTTEPIFNLSITRTNRDFVLTETWIDVSGQNTDTLELRYRVYD